MKEWIVKLGFVVAVVLFLLDDILNWDVVKLQIRQTLSERGVEIERIEKLSSGQAMFAGIEIQGQRFDAMAISYDRVHLCANILKWVFDREDYFQDFTIHQFQCRLGDIPITLNKPANCCMQTGGFSHSKIELRIGLGYAIIEAGNASAATQQINLYQVPIPQAKGNVSGFITLSSKQFDLKYSSLNLSKNITATVKGEWNSQFETIFHGHASLAEIKDLPFQGRLSPTFQNLSNSTLQIKGKWNGRLKELYAFAATDFKLVQGDVAVDWEIKGSLSEPSVSAKADVTNGSFEAPAIGLFLKNLSGKIEGNNDYWVVKDVRANDTEFTHGILSGSGWLDLSPLKDEKPNFRYCLNLQIKNIAVLVMENLTGISSGDLQLHGDKSGAKLVGNGLVHALKLTIDKGLGAKRAPLAIVFDGDLPPATKAPYPVIFDVQLKLEKHALIEGENLHATWTGGAHLGGSVDDLRLKGELKLAHGEYCLNGRDIAIKEGVIRFDGNIFKETSIFAIATMELKELIAEIIVRGHLDTLSLTLRSNPPLPQREILSWVLFNQGAKHITSLQGEQLNRSLSEFTKGGGGKNPLTELQGRLGIDRIDLDRRGLVGDEEVSLKLGKYLSKNLFVGVSKGINSDVNRIGFEASLNEHWKVQGEIGDNAEGQMHLKWKNDY